MQRNNNSEVWKLSAQNAIEWSLLTFACGQKVPVVCPICKGLIRYLESNFCLYIHSPYPPLTQVLYPVLEEDACLGTVLPPLSVRSAPESVTSATPRPPTSLKVYIVVCTLLTCGFLTCVPTSSEWVCKCNTVSDRRQPSSLSGRHLESRESLRILLLFQ